MATDTIPAQATNEDTPRGFAFALAAYFLWGFLPFYMKAVGHIPAIEVLAHRVVWSLPVAGVVLLALRRTGDIAAALRSPRTLGMAAVTALFITANWTTYIWAISAGRALDTALGYFINPLFSILLASVLLKERLTRLQLVAIALVVASVTIITVEAGGLPWVALVLTFTWGLYAFFRKTLPVGPNQGFFLEVLILSPPCLAYIIYLETTGTGHLQTGSRDTLLLMASGLVTAVPLILYANGAKLLRLSTIGLMQYIAPTMIFLIAIFAFHEPINVVRLLAFGLIWLALADGRNDVIDVLDHQGAHQMGSVDEPLNAHVIDQRQHGIPEPADIGENHRLLVAPELAPGHDFDDLLERPDAARQGHEGIRPLEHLVLALMHVGGDDQLVELPERVTGCLHIDQELRNDARHLAAIGQNPCGHRAHDPLGTSAIDQPDTMRGNRLAEGTASRQIGGITAGLGPAAINAAGDAVKKSVTEAPATEKPAETAKASPDAATSPAPPPSSAPAQSANAPQAQQPAAGSTAQQAQAAHAVVTPSFDVLRVEPDGSAVIAGRAAPNSMLEVTNGATVLAKVNVGPSGDFATVLDTPLPPGDHQLLLKATGRDGKPTMSEEAATISVPAEKDGKLLAMVTKPGKASRLITVPGEAPRAPAAAMPADATAQAPALPEAAASGSASLPAVSAPEIAAVDPAAAKTVPPASMPSLAPAELQVSAVEIEGAKIFIAGMAKAGSTVRGAADGTVVGQAQAAQDSHFVIEGTVNLTVGDHRISVETLGAGGQTLVRVDVPFNRPAGDQVAAVASPAPSSPVTATDGGAFDNLRGDVAKAFSLLKGLYSGGKTPTLEAMTAARSSTAIALQSLTDYRLGADASVAATHAVSAAARDAASARRTLDAIPGDVAAVGAALDRLSSAIGKAVGPALAQQLDQGDQAVAAAAAPGPARTIEQPPLTQSDRNSVIIRHGDTLWQIARRVYGQGVRYTTIYLANEDLIGNPDVIQPGQIFGVPQEFRPDAEELHRQRMRERKS
eukprot:g20054.t1